MKSENKYYDVAIIGGGLAGLSSAITLAGKGFRVILFEKEIYPFHKVCGEYISMESYDFLQSLGLPLKQWDLPVITKLQLSSSNGSLLQQPLPSGGFGISRYTIDSALADIAVKAGVELRDNTRVQEIQFSNDEFYIDAGYAVHAKICIGAFGKRSNIDVKWKRSFVNKKLDKLNNYIGVKYHVNLDHPRNTIALHNFRNGYCGISPVEQYKTCICYLTTVKNLRDHENNIHLMEKEVLFKNPFLQKAFTGSDFLYDSPLTISQISFDKKEQVKDHVLLTGDAAGMITPLCGNGMSMALYSGKMACEQIIKFLEVTVTRYEMEQQYDSYG